MNKLPHLKFSRVLGVLVLLTVGACSSTSSSTSSSDTVQDSASVTDAYGAPADTNAVEITTAVPVTTTTSVPASSSSNPSVTTKGFAFTPTSLSISVGQSVAFVVSSSHTVTWQDGEPGRGRTGAAYSRTFSKAGTYSFYCSIHTSMTGTITVS